jgi:hypothetical protein
MTEQTNVQEHPATAESESRKRKSRTSRKATTAKSIAAEETQAETGSSNLLPALGELISTTVYTGAYYAAFTATAGLYLTAKLLPTDNALGRGIHDGTDAARNVLEKKETQRVKPATPATDKNDNPAPAK